MLGLGIAGGMLRELREELLAHFIDGLAIVTHIGIAENLGIAMEEIDDRLRRHANDLFLHVFEGGMGAEGREIVHRAQAIGGDAGITFGLEAVEYRLRKAVIAPARDAVSSGDRV